MSSTSNPSNRLTERERQLIILIARGMQNKNIAHTLKISENTVRAHIANVMRKFNLQNRTQIAMVLALQADLSSPHNGATNGVGAQPDTVSSGSNLTKESR
jgi:DNA-binding NarL/FixJ family response regulator